MALEKSVKNNKYVQKMVKNQIWLTWNEENNILYKYVKEETYELFFRLPLSVFWVEDIFTAMFFDAFKQFFFIGIGNFYFFTHRITPLSLSITTIH